MSSNYKKLLITLLTASASFSASALACDSNKTFGAGGTITFFNNSNTSVLIGYSGLGCAGSAYGLSFLCENAIVPAFGCYRYDYKFGVTTTWINVAEYDPASWDTSDNGAPLHPCSGVSNGSGICNINGNISKNTPTKGRKSTDVTLNPDSSYTVKKQW